MKMYTLKSRENALKSLIVYIIISFVNSLVKRGHTKFATQGFTL